MLLVIISPFIAYAGVFSAVSQLFKSPQVTNTEKPLNLQTIALLQAATAPTNQPVGGGDIAIVDKSALLPENSGDSIGDKEKTIEQITSYTVRK
jgi:hypothetical protein